jgi:alpha-L-rhamnosidase
MKVVAKGLTWRAEMISPDCDGGVETRMSFVTTRFTVGTVSGDETLQATAWGLYEAWINGTRVGRDLLTPGWTTYDTRIAYQSYPVSHLLRPGENRIVIRLADGWWRSQMMWKQAPILNCWGDKLGAFAQIVAGDRLVVATGPDWRSGLDPVTKSGIYWGESYDARLEGSPAETGVTVQPFDRALLVPHEVAPVVELDPLHPVESWADDQGRMIHDFGQNTAALPRFAASGPAGATVLIEFSEQLAPGKMWNNANYRSARAAVDYVLKEGQQSFQPSFTFFGFRYARVTVTGGATVSDLVSVPITSVPERKSTFTCAHPLVNRLVENTVWSQRSNFIEVPTDCPQRDERLGWSGDAQVFAGTACWLADSQRFLTKYLRDLMADQRADGAIAHFSPDPTRLHPVPGRGEWAGSTGWGDAIVIIPWQLYLHYGDRGALQECFPAMRRWLDYLWSISGGPLIRPPVTWGARGFTFGDWLQPGGSTEKPRPTIGDDCAATLYHFISTDLAARIALILGEAAAASDLRARAETIRTAFQAEYFTESGRLAYSDQTSYALAFLYGLVPARHHAAAAARFRALVDSTDGKIGTGFIGTPALLPALQMLGMDDLIAKVFLNEEVPGWLYQVKMGATTIWERWNALAPDGTIFDPAMNSYNHYAYGAVCQWLFEGVAGLATDPDHPGFQRVKLNPVIIPALGHVRATHDSPKGPVAAAWTLSDGRVRYEVSLPDGCEGWFDATPRRQATLDGTAINGAVTVPPGRHVIEFALQ